MVFKPGQSGNPRGRSSRTAAAAAIRDALAAELGDVALAEHALVTTAARLLLQAQTTMSSCLPLPEQQPGFGRSPSREASTAALSERVSFLGRMPGHPEAQLDE